MIHNVLATLTINISNNNMRPFSPGDGRGSQTDWPSANHQYVLFSLDLCPTNGMCTNGYNLNLNIEFMDLGNYGIGGNEVKIDASEGIAEIPQNRTLLVEQLTKIYNHKSQ